GRPRAWAPRRALERSRRRRDGAPPGSRAELNALAIGSLKLGVPLAQAGQPLGGRGPLDGVLAVCGLEGVLDGESRSLAGLGCGEPAAGRLDLAYLLGQRALRERLAGGAVAEECHLEVALEGAHLATGCPAGLAALGAGEGVPGTGEGAEVGAAAVPVRGE